MNSVGFGYQMGAGVATDPLAAVKWYRRGAMAGDAVAMSNLGECYRDGIGVARDLREARLWFERAAAAGDAEATAELARLDAQ